MKKYFWFIALIITFFACSKPVEDHGIPTIPNGPQVTPPPSPVIVRMAIFNKSQKIELYLSGKNVTVDWGNYTKYTYAKPDSTVPLTHYYSSSVHDTVIITGTDISNSPVLSFNSSPL